MSTGKLFDLNSAGWIKLRSVFGQMFAQVMVEGYRIKLLAGSHRSAFPINSHKQIIGIATRSECTFNSRLALERFKYSLRHDLTMNLIGPIVYSRGACIAVEHFQR